MLYQKKATTKKHRNWGKKKEMEEGGFIHNIRVPWESNNSTYLWNEICADIVEVFGLPGDRFMSHPTMDYMDFNFKSEKDMELCKILISEHI